MKKNMKRIEPKSLTSPALAGIFFTTTATCEAIYIYISVCAKLLQSCLTLCDPMNDSPPGLSVHRIPQLRILELVAIAYSRICVCVCVRV